MGTWHEVAEQNPGVAATSHGLVALEGKMGEEARAGERDEDYILFRRAWEELRSRLLSLTPKEGGKEAGAPEIEVRRIDRRE